MIAAVPSAAQLTISTTTIIERDSARRGIANTVPLAKVMAAPATLDMDTWGKRMDVDEEHPCGAVACLAGNAVLLEEPKTFRKLVESPNRDDIQDVAKLLLDLDCNQAHLLFHINSWPYGFFLDYTNPKAEANDRAAVLRDRVEHFISAGGAE